MEMRNNVPFFLSLSLSLSFLQIMSDVIYIMHR